VISRFVDKQFRLAGDEERREYLSRAEKAARRFDWTMLAFSLMSSHTHLASLVGTDALSRFCEQVHSPLAGWLNRRQGRLGPGFADRPTTIEMEPEALPFLIAYIHNNPVRAGCVDDPTDSDWTSHRAYVGLVEPPKWIDVELGLSLCGFSSTPSGRLAFHDFVVSRSGGARDPLLSGDGANARRTELRANHGAPVEATSAKLLHAASALAQDPVIRQGTPMRPRWSSELSGLLELVADHANVTVEEIQSRSKKPETVAARRVAIIAAHEFLGRSIAEITAIPGISGSAGCHLLRRSPERVARARAEALHIAELCRRQLRPEKDTE